MQFIKDLDVGEVWHNYTKSYVEVALGDAHRNEFTLWNSAYLHRASNAEDVDAPNHLKMNQSTSKNEYRTIVKYYS